MTCGHICPVKQTVVDFRLFDNALNWSYEKRDKLIV